MNTIHAGYKGLHLLFDINWDRILYVGAILGALMAGAYLGTL